MAARSADVPLKVHLLMRRVTTSLTRLIGYSGRLRPYESFHSYVTRMIRVNYLTNQEVRKLFPASWLRLAFEPSCASTALIEEVRVQGPGHKRIELHQASSEAWLPMPSLESYPQDRMRYCPECLSAGLHSYAFQATFLARCPYHGGALSDSCATCGAPILWCHHAHAYADGALRCAKGCDIGGEILTGILSPPTSLTAAWAAQWQWIQQFQRHARVILEPVYVGYPPCEPIWREVDRPTPGVFAALIDALYSLASDLPAPTPYHDRDHGAWEVGIQPWDAPASSWSSGADTESVLHAFRRGPYESEVPLPRSPWIDGQLERLKHIASHSSSNFEMRTGRSIDVLILPSFLITNSELAALYRIVMASNTIDTGVSLYARHLVETLNIAYERRQAWDGQNSGDVLNLSERIDGLIQLDDQTFRLTGQTTNSRTGALAWETFTERSYSNEWVIYPATAQALRG